MIQLQMFSKLCAWIKAVCIEHFFLKMHYIVLFFTPFTDHAFVTLATNDSYARGAMVLGKSLRNNNTSKKLVALIGPQVSEPCQ